MGSRLGRRVVNFANLPIKLLMPSSFSNISEIALKTIPSASKIEIKRVLESLYGFEVEKVRTINMEGKKKKRGGLLIAKPDYKKAYVTLKNPLSMNPDLYPIRIIEEDKKSLDKQSKSSIVEDPEAIKKSHWLDEKKDGRIPKRPEGRTFGHRGGGGGDGAVCTSRRGGGGGDGAVGTNRRGSSGGYGAVGTSSGAKFPWSSMRSFGR
ncbi:Ribosomal protein L23/L15e family protein [Forsythia ovata]|uniref:Large ribosomal subunit protein uL23m n=1 Tax=Forsythia ovata TaxID=205694 RepID=A0ABD1U943_9LAMI